MPKSCGRNPIVSGYPDCIELADGTRKPCDVHFRVWLQIARLLDDPAVPELEKAAGAIGLAGIEPGDPALDLPAIIAFLYPDADGTRAKAARRVMDWDIDAGLIVASFQSEYGIDITARECSMHWHRFLDLFRGFGDAAPIIRAVNVRTMELPEGNDANTRKRRESIIEAKRRFALPHKSRAEKEQRERDLWGG